MVACCCERVKTRRVVLSDENSRWGADVCLEVTKDIAGASTASISGMFRGKVFAGSYRNMRTWIEAIKDFVQSKGQRLQRRHFFHATGPKCAKKYGKNYVAILA